MPLADQTAIEEMTRREAIAKALEDDSDLAKLALQCLGERNMHVAVHVRFELRCQPQEILEIAHARGHMTRVQELAYAVKSERLAAGGVL